MTKEQEEAIEIIDKMIKSYIEADECGLSNNDFKEEIEVYDTVLNLITKLQKDNQILKRAFDKQTADMSNNLLELRQKDKQIDLMARAFKQDDVRSVEEIKQYFERKVEDENR